MLDSIYHKTIKLIKKSQFLAENVNVLTSFTMDVIT